MLQLDLREDDRQLQDQLLLLVFLPEHRGHLLLQVADDVSVYLQKGIVQSPGGGWEWAGPGNLHSFLSETGSL